VRTLATLMLLALAQSSAFACGTASVSNYDYGPGARASSYPGEEKVSYFIGQIEELVQGAGSGWRADIRILKEYGPSHFNSLPTTAEFAVAFAGCSGFSLTKGQIGVFAFFEKEGVKYLAGFPGVW
jgi:hypothetical protein